jgi:thiol-disulfide isomerase/thioredoxin
MRSHSRRTHSGFARWALFALLAPLVPLVSCAKPPSKAPEFGHTSSTEWLNSPPLRVAALRGKVVLVEFWAFECVNCLRSVEWIHGIQEQYKDQNLVVIGVHTPELPQERSADNLRKAVAKLNITYPVMLDTDYSYWQAMGNRYWPAFYLIDAQGRVAATTIGEMHVGESRAKEFEVEIAKVVAGG